MHKYPSWVLKEMDDEINDELITDSNVDLLLNVTPRGSFASTRGKEREKKDLFENINNKLVHKSQVVLFIDRVR
jgi:hypothetical protein